MKLLRVEERYLTAAEIFARLKNELPSLARSTVYRTLHLLTESGSISSRTDSAGQASYVLCRQAHHHHAICRLCGRVTDVDCPTLEILRTHLLEQASFELDEHSIEFYGRCADCRQKHLTSSSATA